jgi:ABC-type multidrug transport system fused ATPase/permease subunit
MLLNTIVSIADIGSLALLLALVHYYAQPASAISSGFGLFIKDLQAAHFLLPLLFFLLLFICKNLASYYITKAQYGFIYDVAARISKGNLGRYLNGSYQDYAQVNTSVHVSSISYQPMEFCTYVLSGLLQLFTEVILTTVTVIAILLYNAKLFLLLLLILLPPVMLAAYLSKRRLKSVKSQVKESSERSTQYLHEALAGFIESNVFNKKQFFIQRFAGAQRRLSAMLAELQITQAIPSRLIEVFAVFGLLVLIVVNKYNGNASMELEHVGAFIAAAYKIIPGITRIANISAQMRTFRHTIENVEKPDGVSSVKPATDEMPGIASLAFSDVSFTHHHREVIRRLSFELHRGDFLGISSPSGKGKTTVLNLLLGFLEPDSGSIIINDRPQTAEARKHFREDIAYVKQQTFLIDDTILKNITLGEEAVNETRLQESVSLAGLDDFIRSFPEGLSKKISDSGKNISGGQRQRIALARAFYKNAGLLILDEPFSELDAGSEHAILKHLQQFAAQGKMVLFITHNRGSLQFCNKTVSIDD